MAPESQQPREGQEILLAALHGMPIVLDVGAGEGKWGKLLRGEVLACDAIEAWAPCICSSHLEEIYRQVFNVDVMQCQSGFFAFYDCVILGDVLEHLDRKDAELLVARLDEAKVRTFLTIPISKCIQDGMAYGNPFETHREQWTHDQLVDAGWKLLHVGPNPNGMVLIGTYERNG